MRSQYGFARYLKKKKVRKLTRDPVEDLRAGWDLRVEFGLDSPALYSLMYGDPHPGVTSPAGATARQILLEHMRRLALVGLLRVSEEKAADLVHASGCGTVLTLLAMSEDRRGLSISEAAREAVIAAITTGSPPAEEPWSRSGSHCPARRATGGHGTDRR